MEISLFFGYVLTNIAILQETFQNNVVIYKISYPLLDLGKLTKSACTMLQQNVMEERLIGGSGYASSMRDTVKNYE